MLRALGGVARALGSGFESFGAALQASEAYTETLSRHRQVMGLAGKKPSISESCFIAPSANIVGEVSVGPKSSVWYGAILIADSAKISISDFCSIKDKAIIGAGSTIGSSVIVGHGAVLGSVKIEDGAAIGMGATLEDGVVVQKGAYVAPGSVVTAKTTVTAGQLFAGAPAKALRALTEKETLAMQSAVGAFQQLASMHQEENSKNFLQIEQDKSDQKWAYERNIDYDQSLGLLEKNPRAQIW